MNREELYKLILVKFDDVTMLRTFIWLNLNTIYAEIYGGNPSLATLASSIVETCERFGLTEELERLLK